MLLRFGLRTLAAITLLAATLSLGHVPEGSPRSWIRPIGGPRGPVKILQFYASVGTLLAGDKAKLCYGVENARSVTISPSLPGVLPSSNRCLEINPEHTTHYTILAEGFDGNIATKFCTLVVQTAPAPTYDRFNFGD